MKKNKKLYLGLLCLVISLALFVLVFFHLETDYFWHIKAGEYMYNNGILKHDIFSWYLSSKYWMSHEWLFELIIYILKTIFGTYHIFVYVLLSISLICIILFLPNKKNFEKNIPFTLVYLLAFFLMINSFIQARPHLISFSFLAITIYFLYDLYNNKESKKIYFLPLITILWSNMHGGSSNLSYILCFLFLIGSLFEFNSSKIEAKRGSKTQLKKYLLIMILCMICVCINIHGFKMFLYPYQNILDTTMLNNISEWQNTSLHKTYHLIYYLFVLFIIIIMLVSKRKIRFIDFILLLFVVYLGLKSTRFWFYTFIAITYFIFYYVNSRKVDKHTVPILYLISIILFSCFIAKINNVIDVSYKLNLNNQIVNTIKKEQPKRLFNMYDYGGELIYNDILVFIDGRADLYSKYNYKDYLNISNLNKDYVYLINKYDFDYFLVSTKFPINTYLNYSDQYIKVYDSKNIVLYKKIVNS